MAEIVEFRKRNNSLSSRRRCRNPLTKQPAGSWVLLMEPTLCEVDGRTGWQWVVSILFYLEWRSGREWRPPSHRFFPEVENYVRAIRLVKDADRRAA